MNCLHRKEGPTTESVEAKRPVTCLLIAEHLINDTAVGVKFHTVREGTRDYRAGDKLVLACPECEWSSQLMTVTEVSHTTIAKMKRKDYLHHSWKDRKHALSNLRRYYPTLRATDPITVIWWNHPDATT